MTDAQKESVALFRYGLIAPILSDYDHKKSYIQAICAKIHVVPVYGKREFANKTIAEWLRLFRKHGLPGLFPKSRSDIGVQRVILPELRESIITERQKAPDLSVVLFYKRLVKSGVIYPDKVSYHSVYRLLKVSKLLRTSDKDSSERKRFSHSVVNFVWQTDASAGPYLKINGKSLQTNLFAIIDDCSRVITFAQFFFTEKQEDFLSVVKQAVLRRGIPKILYTDNGKVFCSKMLEFVCAGLQINLVHTHPYDPRAKGKIERFFGTVRSSFYPLLKLDPVGSIEELNSRFWRWLEDHYHRTPHSSIGCPPLELFMSQAESLRLVANPDDIQSLFWNRAERKVHSDCTVSLDKRLYEAPQVYAGQKLDIRFDPDNPEKVFAFKEGKPLFQLNPVNQAANAHAKRVKASDSPAIQFQSLFSGEGM